MGRADLHIHSTYSFDGSAAVEAILEQAAHRAHLDMIAITDHDAIFGALKAERLGPAYGIQVIPGSEISTADGHLIALFIRRPVPPHLPLVETVRRVAEQGGICIVPHPMGLAVPSVTTAVLEDALRLPEIRETLVGVETINAGLLYRGSNHSAQRLCRRVGLSPVGSSDSHLVWTVGHGVTEYPGSSAEDLRRALTAGTTRAVNQAPHRSIRFYASSVLRRILRMLGWVTWTPSPHAALRLRPLTEIQD